MSSNHGKPADKQEEVTSTSHETTADTAHDLHLHAGEGFLDGEDLGDVPLTVDDLETLEELLVPDEVEDEDDDEGLAGEAWSSHTAGRSLRGLPKNEDLQELARVYLTNQRRLWPELIPLGILPEPTKANLKHMVAQYKQQFVAQTLDVPALTRLEGSWESLGESYLRYSCDHSNPRSLPDQLHLQLEEARGMNVFIPWLLVCGDASVSGTITDRTGYRLAKQGLKLAGEVGISTLFIDEIGRASRDAIEALQLGQLVDRLRKRLIGVSDSFDSSETMAKLKLHLFAMLAEWFIDQLRAKVRRGMHGAARRGTSTGKTPVGVRLVPVIDQNGNTVVGADGQTVMTHAIEPETFQHVRRAFEMFACEHQSTEQIARYFNRLRVDGRATWTSSGIAKMLRNPKYVGIVIYNRVRYELGPSVKDPEKLVRKKIENPRSEWIVRRNHQLQKEGLPWKLWKAAQRRLQAVRDASPLTGRKLESKAHLYPSTLVDGLLVCPVRGHELKLSRSCGKYQQVACPNGKDGKHACTFRGSKSVRILEEALLRYVEQKILSDAVVPELVARGNELLAEEAQRPKVDTAPLRAQLQEAEAQAKNLHQFVLDHRGEFDMSEYLRDEAEAKRRIAALRQDIRDAEAASAEPPDPLTEDGLRTRLADLRELLHQDKQRSAGLLRALFGQLEAHETPVPGKKRPAWTLKGQVTLHTVLTETSRLTGKDYPDSATLEHLKLRIWIKPEPVSVTLQRINVTEQIADAVVAALKAGTPREQVAKDHGVDPTTIDRTWRLRVHGIDRSDYDPGLKAFNPPRQRATRPEEVMDQVAALRHVEGLDLKEIAQRLGLPVKVVGEAHRLWHQHHPDGPGDIPWSVLCGKAGKLTPAQRRQVCDLALAGWREHQILEKLPFEKGHVHKVFEALQREQQRRRTES